VDLDQAKTFSGKIDNVSDVEILWFAKGG